MFINLKIYLMTGVRVSGNHTKDECSRGSEKSEVFGTQEVGRWGGEVGLARSTQVAWLPGESIKTRRWR